ncbi:MAG: hypothetical protein K0Q93_3041 [Nocardioidaceae bacterium]|jgi:hypothetical protein|nr:hypothetical protein [Nocardioidaceae bacterium]
MRAEVFRHGTVTCYRKGCRCDSCKAIHLGEQRAIRQRRRAERVEVDGALVHPSAKHGTASGYGYFACRCPACTRNNREGVASRKASGVPGR